MIAVEVVTPSFFIVLNAATICLSSTSSKAIVQAYITFDQLLSSLDIITGTIDTDIVEFII
jgi:hypothetical protein